MLRPGHSGLSTSLPMTALPEHDGRVYIWGIIHESDLQHDQKY